MTATKPSAPACHEALHMAHTLADLVETGLCEHPAIQANAFWHAKATAAADALHDLRQAIARAQQAPAVAADLRSVGPEDESRGGHEAPGRPGPTVPGTEQRRPLNG